MKIVTKHVDVLEGTINPKDFVNKYIVYLQGEDGKNISADECYGDMEKEAAEDALRFLHQVKEVEFIPLETAEQGK